MSNTTRTLLFAVALLGLASPVHAKKQLALVEASAPIDGNGAGSGADDGRNGEEADASPLCEVPEAVANDDEIDASFSCDRWFGNDDFGVGYVFSGALEAEDRGGNDHYRIDDVLAFEGAVFGNEITLLEASMFADATDDDDTYGELVFQVLGSTADIKADDPHTLRSSFEAHPSLPHVFAEYESWFPVGGIFTVTVRAGLTGELGVDAVGEMGRGLLEAHFEPYVQLDAYATAALCVGSEDFLSFGVDVDLLIARLGLPIDSTLDPILGSDHDRVDWSLESSLELRALAGEVQAWVRALGRELYRTTIASWTGLQREFPIVEAGELSGQTYLN